MRRFVFETLHPEIYHGHKKRSPYFEGWYYKLISADEQQRYAIIPGIFRGQAGGDHAFVQVLNGMTGEAHYFEYPASAFYADEEHFDIWVGPNHFLRDCISLQLENDHFSLKGELRFEGGESWPVSILEPGVMGWYAWMPFMECYHGVLSFDHLIRGNLAINGEVVGFEGGRGYMEKDWGQAFPSAYIWHQSNHFDTPGTSLFGSVALIPWIGRTFRGFLVGFYHHRRLYKMTTYTGAEIEQINLTDQHVIWIVADKYHRIELKAERGSGGLLKAPVRTEMHKRVDETMRSTMHVRLSTRSGETIYEGEGRNAALEVHGDLETLLKTR
ncbi:MAG: tocopherol cyclase family protein [Chloroflexota bacterium]